MASRGCYPSELRTSSRWWNGPPWLCQPVESWPFGQPDLISLDKIPDLKVYLSARRLPIKSDWIDFHDGFSNLLHLQRAMVYVLRFTQRCAKHSYNIGSITVPELKVALTTLIKQVQECYFAAEMKLLKEKGLIHNSLAKLSPFLDNHDVLRVGGRLLFADISYDSRHPSLLPKNATLTRLLVQFYHRTFYTLVPAR